MFQFFLQVCNVPNFSNLGEKGSLYLENKMKSNQEPAIFPTKSRKNCSHFHQLIQSYIIDSC